MNKFRFIADEKLVIAKKKKLKSKKKKKKWKSARLFDIEKALKQQCARIEEYESYHPN